MKRAVLVATIIVLAGGVIGNSLRFAGANPTRPADFSQVPFQLEQYSGEERFFDSAAYEVLKADTSTLRLYRDTSGTGCWLFVAYFASQKYGSQIHSPRHCLPGSGWRIDSHQPLAVELPGKTQREVNRLVISDGDVRQLMLYWFETRSGIIRTEYGLKFDLIRNALTLSATDAAIIRVTVPIIPGDNIETATQRGVKFITSLYPSIEHALPLGS